MFQSINFDCGLCEGGKINFLVFSTIYRWIRKGSHCFFNCGFQKKEHPASIVCPYLNSDPSTNYVFITAGFSSMDNIKPATLSIKQRTKAHW
jgi:hypothetical protein